MLDCKTCYRLQHCGDNIYYCSFAGQNPCIMGLHTTHIPSDKVKAAIDVEIDTEPPTRVYGKNKVPTEQLKELLNVFTPIKVIAKQLGVPSSAIHNTIKKLRSEGYKTPLDRRGYPKTTPPFKEIKTGRKTKIDWKKYHKRIYAAYMAGSSFNKIARELGCHDATVLDYLKRYKEE